MAGYAEIAGHDNLIEHFRRAVCEGKVSHSYIISGEEHAGKMMIAEAFARALQCTEAVSRQTGDGCGRCISCMQAASHNHPDILYVTHEKSVISVEDVRQQIVATAEIFPYAGNYKVYIVDEAERMNEQAQNALLKTIEEPPAYVVILLLTSQIGRLLPTIRSRCVEMALRPVSEAKIRAYLERRFQIPEYSARLAASFAQGNVGRAVAYASSPAFGEVWAQCAQIMKRLPRMRMSELMEEVRGLAAAKKEIDQRLEFMTLWCRDLLMCKAAGDEAKLICLQEEKTIREQAGHISYEGIEECIRVIRETGARLRANVNFDVAVEMMLVQMRDRFQE